METSSLSTKWRYLRICRKRFLGMVSLKPGVWVDQYYQITSILLNDAHRQHQSQPGLQLRNGHVTPLSVFSSPLGWFRHTLPRVPVRFTNYQSKQIVGEEETEQLLSCHGTALFDIVDTNVCCINEREVRRIDKFRRPFLRQSRLVFVIRIVVVSVHVRVNFVVGVMISEVGNVDFVVAIPSEFTGSNSTSNSFLR